MTIGGHVPCFELVLVMEALVCLLACGVVLILSYFVYRSTYSFFSISLKLQFQKMNMIKLYSSFLQQFCDDFHVCMGGK